MYTCVCIRQWLKEEISGTWYQSKEFSGRNFEVLGLFEVFLSAQLGCVFDYLLSPLDQEWELFPCFVDAVLYMHSASICCRSLVEELSFVLLYFYVD